MIEVEHLSKSYGNSQAVNDISFTVNKGEILGFLGPNGAGKTTTMRIITGYLPATKGTVRVSGFDVAEQSLEVRKRIGYLPETPPLYPEMSVRDYLHFIAQIKGVASADIGRRTEYAMEATGLIQRKDDLIKRLSRGYKQRVGIAQAIVHDPDVVILDEPTNGLDPNQIIEVRHLINTLAGEHTIILSTHILPEVEETCQRVVIINQGRIVAMDTPKNLAQQRTSSARTHLLIKGETEAVKSTLTSIAGVTNVEVSDQGELLSATVESQTETDLRSQIAARVIGSGFELYELRAETLSLEDVFRQLTTEEKPTTAAKETTVESPVKED
ncbi:MAG TPA: ABC transporter ATP-binding protein [Blastocatellia bacterium]|nr:ABC transporter ATP-binding protein [Blastocatellia bacterium]